MNIHHSHSTLPTPMIYIHILLPLPTLLYLLPLIGHAHLLLRRHPFILSPQTNTSLPPAKMPINPTTFSRPLVLPSVSIRKHGIVLCLPTLPLHLTLALIRYVKTATAILILKTPLQLTVLIPLVPSLPISLQFSLPLKLPTKFRKF